MKRKNYILFLLLACLLSSCVIRSKNSTQGPEETRVYQTGDFNSIESLGPIDVIYSPGPVSVKVKTRKALFDKLNIFVKDSILHVDMKRGTNFSPINGNIELTLYCSNPNISGIVSSGSGDIHLKDGKMSQLEIISTGSGDIEVKNYEFGRLKVQLAGAGSFEAEDLICGSMEAEGSGSSDISMEKSRIGSLFAATSGAGDIEIKKSDINDINVMTSGSGDIYLSGDIKGGIVEVRGAGDIELDVKDKSNLKIRK